MEMPHPAAFNARKPFWLSMFLGWMAGVEPERLAVHTASARTLTKAIGIIMLLVSAPIAWAAMSCYVYESTNGWPPIARWPTVVISGLAWSAIATVGIDRTLLIAADAVGIGSRVGWLFSLAIRASIAALMASLFSEMLVEAQFRGISAVTAQHIGLDLIEQDRVRIAQMEGVPQAQKILSDLQTQADSLQKKHAAQVAALRMAETRANRCDQDAAGLRKDLEVARVAVLVDAGEVTRLEADLVARQAVCKELRTEVVRRQSLYVKPLATEIANNGKEGAAAANRLEDATAQAANRSAVLDEVIRDGYDSISGRKVAFEQAKQRYPEVRRSALLWWIWFFAAEMAPLVLKALLLRNNPPSSEAQADLAEEAGRHRMRSRRARIIERQFTNVLDNPVTQVAMSEAMRPNVIAIERLSGHGAFLAELARTAGRQKAFAEAYPDLAGQAYQAYAKAVADALDALGRSPSSHWARDDIFARNGGQS